LPAAAGGAAARLPPAESAPATVGAALSTAAPCDALPSLSPLPLHPAATPATTSRPAASHLARAVVMAIRRTAGAGWFPTSLDRSMSTRRLIVAALVCGIAILVAFAVQVWLVL